MNGTKEHIDDVAVFFDFENIVYALRNNFNINANFEDMMDKCKEFGRVVVAHAFADWNRHSGSMTTALISNGIDPVYVPTFYMDEGGKQTPRKNAVDMYMAIDAMDVLHNRKSVDTFILLTGDSDFVPLVNAIRREGNRVIAIGVDGTTSSHLMQSVDEFILYSQISNLQSKSYNKKKPKDPFDGLVQAVQKLQKQKKVALLPNVKMMMAELMGGFDEKKHSDSSGRRYQKFKEFVQDAEARDMVKLITTGTVNEIYLPGQTPVTDSEDQSSSGRDRDRDRDRDNGRDRDRNDRRSSRDRNDRDQQPAEEPEAVETNSADSTDAAQSGLTLTVAFDILIEAVNKAKEAGRSMRPPSIKGIMRNIYPEFDEKKIVATDRKAFTRFGEFTAAAAEQGLITITGKGPRQEISLTKAVETEDAVSDAPTESENAEVEAAAVAPVTLNGDIPEDIEARILIIETLTTYPNYPASFLQVESYCRQLRNKKKIELSSTRVRSLMTEVTRSLQLLKRVSKPGKSPSQYKLDQNDQKIAEFLGVPADSVAAVMQGEFSIAEQAASEESSTTETAPAEEVVESAEANNEAEKATEEAAPETTDEATPEKEVVVESKESEATVAEATVASEDVAKDVAEDVATESEPAEEPAPEAVAEVVAPEPLTPTGAYRLLVAAITQNKEEEKSLKLRSIKTTMVTLNPIFDEKNFLNDREKPFKSFIEFTRAAARDGIVELTGKGQSTEISIVE